MGNGNTINHHYKALPFEDITGETSCGYCHVFKKVGLKIYKSASRENWWWQDVVCSEECYNLWLLQRL